jgi:hypothetical protein
MERLTEGRWKAIVALSAIPARHAGSGCNCNECLRAEALPELIAEIEQLRNLVGRSWRPA